MFRHSLAGALMLGLSACVAAAGQGRQGPADFGAGTGKVEMKTLLHDGLTREYGLYIPPGYRAGPLVLLLHGGGGTIENTLSRAHGEEWKALADRHGFLLAVPQGAAEISGQREGYHWNDHRDGERDSTADDTGFILMLMDLLGDEYAVDSQQVFVTGASNGGMMTYRLLSEYPERFAAGAAFIANLPTATPGALRLGAPVPVMIVNGTDDPLMKWEGGNVGRRGIADTVLSARDTLAWWQGRNGTGTDIAARRSLPDRAPSDGCRLHVEDYRRGGDVFVRFVTMEGGGHAPPALQPNSGRNSRLYRRLIGTTCHDASGAALAWEFFNR